MKLAIDFDGTIVEHRYPEIGREMLFAFDTLKALQEQGHQLILWTYRTGRELDEAVEYCRKNGIEFYAINNSYPEEVFNNNYASRKIMADVFVDDKNIGGFPGWGVIWNLLNPSSSPSPENERRMLNERKPTFWNRFF
jgi:hypothetical protein